MRQIFLNRLRNLGLVVALSAMSLFANAQDAVDVDVNKEEIGTWLEQNWMWVVAGVVLLILIISMAGRRRRGTRTYAGGKRRTTTVVEDASGNTKSVTTTEENL